MTTVLLGKDGALTLRAGSADDDSWAYTPEHRALLARAHADSREGRVRQMTESESARLGGLEEGRP